MHERKLGKTSESAVTHSDCVTSTYESLCAHTLNGIIPKEAYFAT